MALTANVVWRVRVSGLETNGGGYDATVAGAGTDYSDQDAPQLSITDLVSSASTTVTSATGGFTAAMVGNVLRLASAAGSPVADAAGSRYLMITARTNTNTITVDKASGTFTAGVAKIGGATNSLATYSNGGSGLATPTLTTPLLAGHKIGVRGAGTSSPASMDYDCTAGYWTFPAGSTAGKIWIFGYNGRPRIDTCALFVHQIDNLVLKDLVLFQNSATYNGNPLLTTAHCWAENCLIDQNGNDTWKWSGHLLNCIIKNSGSTSAGTSYAYACQNSDYARTVIGCVFQDLRGGAISDHGSGSVFVANSLVVNCKGTSTAGVLLLNAANIPSNLNNVTIDAGAGDGIRVSDLSSVAHARIMNCIVSNHVGSGKYGLNVTVGSTSVNDSLAAGSWDYNNLYNNTTARLAISAGAHDIALDPQYTNTAAGDYSVGTNMKAVGFPGLFPA